MSTIKLEEFLKELPESVQSQIDDEFSRMKDSYNNQDGHCCKNCNGRGFISYYESHGQPYGHEEIVDLCPNCLWDDKCPSCGEPVEFDESTDLFKPCACGWKDESLG